MDQTWRSLASSFVNMHQSISHLVHAAASAADALSVHTDNAIGAQVLQNDTIRVAIELADVISHLRDVAHTELEWINGTGREIRERMLLWDSSSWNWGWKAVAWFTRLAWHGESLSSVAVPLDIWPQFQWIYRLSTPSVGSQVSESCSSPWTFSVALFKCLFRPGWSAAIPIAISFC